MNEAAALPITGGSVVRSARPVHMAASDSLPAPVPPSRLEAGYRTGRSDSNNSQTAGPGRASPVPAATFSTFRAPYAGRFLRTRSRIKRPFHGLHRDTPGSAPPLPTLTSGPLTTRQASLHATDRQVAPPTGLLTLGSDPARFQTEPPACYRASWQLLGRDSHPLATTSLCWSQLLNSSLQLWAHPRKVS